MNEKYHGPFTTEEVASLLRKKKITTNDYIYDTQLCCIFFIGDLKIFEKFLPISPENSNKLNNAGILIFQNEEITGPYTHEEVVDLIECHQISVFDFYNTYSNEEIKWERIKNGKLFQAHLPKPPEKAPENNNRSSKELSLSHNIIRKYPRTPYSARTTLEFNQKKINGTCTMLAIGGCYVETKVIDFKIGDEIDIKISPDIVPLNIHSKGRITSITKENVKGIGIQFIDLDEDTKSEINNFVTKYVNALKEKG